MKNSIQRADTIERGIQKELDHAHVFKWFHLAVIVGSLVFTLLSWQISKQQLAEKVEVEFDREWSTLLQLISDRMKNYEELLWSGVAAIKSHDNKLDRLTWRSYADQLALEKRFPGALGVGVIYEVERHELAGFLAEQRAFAPDFDVHPSVDVDTFYPITYIEPELGNKKAVGLDMAHEANRLNATLVARSSAGAIMTGPIQLVQGVQNTPGFLFFAPFYEEKSSDQGVGDLIGLVYSPLVFKNLILGTLGADQRRVNFSLSDAEFTLYDEIAEHELAPAKFVKTKRLALYGRDWDFEFHSTPELEAHLESNLPSYILIGGLVFEIFYIVALLLLSQHRKNAMGLAQHIVEEYKLTAQKNQDIEQRHDLAIKGSAVGLWDWDIVLKDVFWSDHFFDILGVEKIDNHIELTYFLDRLHPDDKDRLAREVEGHLHGNEPFNTEYRLKHEDGHYVWIHASGQALWSPDGTAIRMSGSASNITEKKLAAEELLSLNAELTKFAHLASHDLKTPLRGISNLTQWIEEDQGHALDEESIERLHMIRERVLLTQNMLQDILTYSESGVASVQTEWVSPSLLLSQIVEYMQLSEQQQVVFSNDVPEIYTVETQLRQVFTNAITNAFNHHDLEQQNVVVACEVVRDGLRFRITDDGPGIPKNYHEQVFELFNTLKAKGKGGGTGLGMSIIKRLVEGQKGEVHIESTDGVRGTSICFTWPAILKQEAA